jgi:hypothetical protein
MPPGAVILSVQKDDTCPGPDDRINLWAMVCAEQAPTEARWFRLIVTGGTVPEDEYLTYLATVQTLGGRFVVHVFERMGNPEDEATQP